MRSVCTYVRDGYVDGGNTKTQGAKELSLCQKILHEMNQVLCEEQDQRKTTGVDCTATWKSSAPDSQAQDDSAALTMDCWARWLWDERERCGYRWGCVSATYTEHGMISSCSHVEVIPVCGSGGVSSITLSYLLAQGPRYRGVQDRRRRRRCDPGITRHQS
jgi:hypothetical protein